MRHQPNKERSVRKNLILVNMIIVLPLLLIFFFLLSTGVQSALDSSNETKLQALESKAENVLAANTEVNKLMASFTTDSDMHMLLSVAEDYQTPYELLQINQAISAKCVEIVSMYATDWYEVVVFSEDNREVWGTSISSNLSGLELAGIQQEEWYQEVVDNSSRIIFFPQYQSQTLSTYLPDSAVYAVTVLQNRISGRIIATVVVAMSEEMFVDDLLQFDSGDENGIVTDRYGEIIFASDPALYQLDLEEALGYSDVLDETSGYYTAKVDGVMSDVRFATVDNVQWKVFTYNQQEYVWTNYVIITIVFGVFLALAIIGMMRYNSTFIYNKMSGINRHIQIVTQGDLGARLHKEDYEIEFHDLCQNFNEMMDAVQSLLYQLHQEEKKKYALEYKTLQAQINPHFLYNTLATIRFMIQMGQYQDADRATITFSKLLRKSFSDNRSIISIEEELALAGDYMDLMQIRHQNTFEWSIDIDPTVGQYGILKNTIQPLVENSISHGFNTKQTMGHIQIVAKRVGDNAQIDIIDDGVGADIEKINQRLSHDSGQHDIARFAGIGVTNVHQRMQRHFGATNGLTARINQMGGVTFRATFPITFVKEQIDENRNRR